MLPQIRAAWAWGGMTSKLTFTRLANSLGIKVIITGLEREYAIFGCACRRAGHYFFTATEQSQSKTEMAGQRIDHAGQYFGR